MLVLFKVMVFCGLSEVELFPLLLLELPFEFCPPLLPAELLSELLFPALELAVVFLEEGLLFPALELAVVFLEEELLLFLPESVVDFLSSEELVDELLSEEETVPLEFEVFSPVLLLLIVLMLSAAPELDVSESPVLADADNASDGGWGSPSLADSAESGLAAGSKESGLLSTCVLEDATELPVSAAFFCELWAMQMPDTATTTVSAMPTMIYVILSFFMMVSLSIYLSVRFFPYVLI